MREGGCHHVPVVDEEDRVVGMVSSHDLLKALVLESDPERPLKQGALKGVSVSEVMRRNVVTVPLTATLRDAAQMLADGDFHALPVVSPGDVLAGIVTSSDLMGSLVKAVEPSAAAEPAPDSQAGDDSDEQIRLLRRVYLATFHYLESGGGAIEHRRLMQAVADARERIAPGDLLPI